MKRLTGILQAEDQPGQIYPGDIPSATTTTIGGVTLASVTVAKAGTNTTKAVTPAGLPLRVEGNALVRQDGYGGNARGSGAVDLQRERADTVHVASGTAAVIAGGVNNKASGAHSSIGGGGYNNASGNNSTV
ncbi:MAG: hypothetical protein DSY80_06170, partial [Desulfocapsa sp.]